VPRDRWHRILLAIGYRLPGRWQRPFHRWLYDGPPVDPEQKLVVSIREDDGLPVRFEFVGGSRDGEVHMGPIANPYFWKSEHGRVGCRFLVPTPAAIEAVLRGEPTGPVLDQHYEVVENTVVDGVRRVRAESRSLSDAAGNG
jgi:hypothetical protein